MKSRSLFRHSRRGNSVLEATLTLMLFLVFWFSLFDFGWVLFQHQTILHQARAGARWGVVNPDDTAAIKNVVLYNSTTGSGPGMLGLDPASVSVTRSGEGTAADRITVTVSNFSFVFITPWHAGKTTGKTISVSLPVE